jgi:uncharacterized membrane protein
MQNVNTVIRRPIPIGTAVATGLLTFVAGAVLALGGPVLVAGLSTSHSSNATLSVPAAGAQLSSHNRSELGLDVTPSAGAQQSAHNRSEEGLR